MIAYSCAGLMEWPPPEPWKINAALCDRRASGEARLTPHRPASEPRRRQRMQHLESLSSKEPGSLSVYVEYVEPGPWWYPLAVHLLLQVLSSSWSLRIS
mmetsp:Transcript_57485/g.153559  ORF Transcript_57485/g.153559 Transcript_57485/m.153559 type:complete len:99 (-) Transcript_57485:83-379(-)